MKNEASKTVHPAISRLKLLFSPYKLPLLESIPVAPKLNLIKVAVITCILKVSTHQQE